MFDPAAEYGTHLIDCGDCLADLDPHGDVQPVTLCPTGDLLAFAAKWDADVAWQRGLIELGI